MDTSYPNTQLFINGHWKDAAAKEIIDVINPATESVIGNMAHARKEQNLLKFSNYLKLS